MGASSGGGGGSYSGGGGGGSGPLSRHKKAVIILCTTSLILFFFYSQEAYYPLRPFTILDSSGPAWDDDDHAYLVRTPGCKIRAMDPYDPTVNKFLRDSNPPSCKKRPLVTIKQNNRLLLDDRLRKTDWKFKGATCCWRNIQRVQQDPNNYDDNADYKVIVEPKCTDIPPGPNGTLVEGGGAQYLQVECFNPLKVKVWQDFFALVPSPMDLSETTRNKTRAWDLSRSLNKTLPPSVLVIGIDSISRLHMIRSLPRTKELLSANGFIEMRGYTKVGDNTFPNIMAAFGGMTEKEGEKCWPTRSTKLDDCPFIWYNFSANNYITSLVEDSPGIAIFNYYKTGFVVPPVDYYLRPLMVAEHQGSINRHRYGGANDCLGGGLTPTKLLLRYIQSFVGQVGKLAPFFLLSWFTSAAHDEFNGLKHYDKDFRQFLQEIISTVGDNTLILFISDHGYRFGPFRETFLGFYEESLPFFFIRLPPSLKTSFPTWNSALWANSARLTAPHDLYSTFVQLLSVIPNYTHPNTTTPTHAPSLFQMGPLNRTCENSQIPQKYCMCGVSPTLTTSSNLATELGHFIVQSINDELSHANLSDTCVKITYSKFLYGREVGQGEVWNGHGRLEPYTDILIAIETKPWEGRFEARIRLRNNPTPHNKQLLGSVGRINAYAGKSDCITHYIIKNYCSCKNLWEEEQKRRRNKKDKKKAEQKMKQKKTKKNSFLYARVRI